MNHEFQYLLSRSLRSYIQALDLKTEHISSINPLPTRVIDSPNLSLTMLDSHGNESVSAAQSRTVPTSMKSNDLAQALSEWDSTLERLNELKRRLCVDTEVFLDISKTAKRTDGKMARGMDASYTHGMKTKRVHIGPIMTALHDLSARFDATEPELFAVFVAIAAGMLLLLGMLFGFLAAVVLNSKSVVLAAK